jgi:aldehyde:ferredoxin oxidoreductase
MTALTNAATGFGYTEEGLKQVGERVWTVERLFNLREGFSREDDTLPDRLFTLPIHDGPSKGAVVDRDDFDREMTSYYTLWGWDSQGVPKKETLAKLGIGIG